MELYFIRHAESTNNALWTAAQTVEGRQPDPELTDRGLQQAALVAEHLKPNGEMPVIATEGDYQNQHGYGITHLYASLMTRALLTGSAIATALELPLAAHADLHEFGGIFQYRDKWEREFLPGPPKTYFAQRFPHVTLPVDLPADGWYARRAEDRAGMLARAARLIEDLRRRHDDDDRVAIISHGGFYQAFMYNILQLPVGPANSRPPFAFTLHNCGITRVRFYQDRTVVYYMNKTRFLPPELHTR